MGRRLGVVGKPGGVKSTRIRIPVDIQRLALTLPQDDPRRAELVGSDGRAKANLVRSTRRADRDEADAKSADAQAYWKGVFADLRRRPDPTDTTDALMRIDQWRRREVKAATSFDIHIALMATRPKPGPREPGDGIAMTGVAAPAPGITGAAVAWAEGFFARHPHLSREAGADLKTGRLIALLDKADHGEAWRDVEDFDLHMLETIGPVAAAVRAYVRGAFARAWGEVEMARERERQHAANLLKVVSEAQAGGITLPQAPGYVARAGDRTVGELLDAYAKAKPSKDAVAPARLLRELLGADTPVRAVTRKDGQRVFDFVERIPVNVGQQKRYRGLTLVQAADLADQHDASVKDPSDRIKRISTTTASHYLNRAAMIWNWAIKEDDGWADRNPFRGLANEFDEDDARDVRGFTNDELGKLFAHLAPYRAVDSYLFWVPALALNGARLSELCQLRVDDVRTDDGTPYLDIGLHDAAGKRDPMKSVKNAGSVRRAPIHRAALDAGFLEFVDRRRAAGGERLFADIKAYKQPTTGDHDWSHYASRAFADAIDSAVSTDIGLRFHSFRHGFRTRAEAVDVPEASIDAIAGWRQKTVGRKYGKRAVEMLAGHLARLDYGDLKL